MCRVLMSINLEFAEKIMQGAKWFEYRRIKCKRNVTDILIYVTAPVKKVIGNVKVEEVLEDKIEAVWSGTKDASGINETFYYQYFDGKDTAVAYKLGKVTMFKQPKTLNYYGVKSAPQSYTYIK